MERDTSLSASFFLIPIPLFELQLLHVNDEECYPFHIFPSYVSQLHNLSFSTSTTYFNYWGMAYEESFSKSFSVSTHFLLFCNICRDEAICYHNGFHIPLCRMWFHYLVELLIKPSSVMCSRCIHNLGSVILMHHQQAITLFFFFFEPFSPLIY